jgi:hypothetical protein
MAYKQGDVGAEEQGSATVLFALGLDSEEGAGAVRRVLEMGTAQAEEPAIGLPWLRVEDQLRAAAGGGRRGHHIVSMPHLVVLVLIVVVPQRRHVAVGRGVPVGAAAVVAEEPLPFACLFVPVEGELEGDIAELLLWRV